MNFLTNENVVIVMSLLIVFGDIVTGILFQRMPLIICIIESFLTGFLAIMLIINIIYSASYNYYSLICASIISVVLLVQDWRAYIDIKRWFK